MKLSNLIFLCILFYSGFLCAETIAGDADLTKMLSGVLIDYASSHPWIMLGLLVMAKARAIFKPLFWALHKFTGYTETNADNKILNGIEKSKLLAGIYWFADFLISTKVVDPKKQILREYKKLN